MMTKYWIVVASKNHVQIGVRGGFAQANHGKSSALKRMQPGDWIIYYSSKLEFGKDDKCQAFTAIGQVKEGPIYTANMGNGFVPARRDVNFRPSNETPIAPLIPGLSFIADKTHWGAPFRFGVVEIGREDFEKIARPMLGDVPS